MNGYLKVGMPHFIAIILFLLISAIYYAPALSGKVLRQSDNIQAAGMQKEINEIRAKGEHPLWTNSMFGGMPVFQIHMPAGNNMTRYFNKVFLFGGKITSPNTSMFLMMAMFYILMIAMGVDWRVGIIGSIAYGMATNHVVLTEAGHTTKLITMAYLPPTLAGIFLVFRGKYLLGGILTALFLSLQILANHVQISYYFFLAVFFLGILEGVKALKAKELPKFGKAVGVLMLAGMIGVGANIARLWTTYEYTDETIRGKSEISIEGQYSQSSSNKDKGDGLSKDYIFGWSYGISETWTVLIPDYMGRKSGSFISDQSSNSYAAWQREIQKLQQQGNQNVNQLAQQLAQVANTYRGDVQFTSGPIYWGAVMCFLFVLGLFMVRGPTKWWLLISTILMMFFAWGRHFPQLNFFLYEHFPMFNKFRAVMMALGVGQLFVTLLGILAIKELVTGDMASKQKAKNVLIAGGITGGLCLLIYLGGMMGFIDFSSPRDNQQILDTMPEFRSAIYADRAAMLQSDALRSFLFIALAAGALWAYAAGKIKWMYALPVLGALVLLDFWLVDQRFIGAENFQTKQETREVEQPRAADQQIMNDKDLHFRVLDLSRGGNPFQSGLPSYFHKSLGGYHAAKLMRFQDLCEHYLFALNPGDPQFQNITGMFNTKYFILQNPQSQGQTYAAQNPGAVGPAWFVKEYELVEDANAEIKALATLDIRQKAVIEQKYADYVKGLTQDSTITAGDNITMTSYHPDKMVYSVKTSKDRLAMFGEVYYPPSKGWNVYIDGKKVKSAFIKANYAIRAVRVPAGEYQLEMRFEPKSYKTGSLIGLACSLLIILGLGFYLYTFFKGFDASKYITEKPVKEEPKGKNTVTKKTTTKRDQPSKGGSSPRRKPPKRRK